MLDETAEDGGGGLFVAVFCHLGEFLVIDLGLKLDGTDSVVMWGEGLVLVEGVFGLPCNRRFQGTAWQ